MTSTARRCPPTRPPGSARPPTSATSSNAVGCSRRCGPGQAASSSSSTRPRGTARRPWPCSGCRCCRTRAPTSPGSACTATTTTRTGSSPTCWRPCAGRSRRPEDALGELEDLIEQSAEDTQRYTLSALLELIARHGGRFVLTFDDWHLIDDAQVHRALVHLLDFAPPNLSLILTSRTRPRLPLSRLRVRRQLTEVDADTLRFDLDETRAFLVDLNGLPPRRRRRRAALRGHRRLGRGPAARVALAARLRRPARS